MQKLLQGLQHYQTKIFGTQRELFERLSQGQAPDVLFITCSDSRINPNLLTQTEPGELFILRNAGNLVPPYGAVRQPLLSSRWPDLASKTSSSAAIPIAGP